MNLDFDLSAVSRLFRGVVTEFRQKRLWPVALVLVLALVAVPVVLSKSGSTPAQPVAQVPTPPPASSSSIPALNVQAAPTHTHLSGPAHDPFAAGGTGTVTAHSAPTISPAPGTTSTAVAPSTSPVPTISGGSAGAGTGSSTSPSTSPSGGGSTPPIGNPPSITHGAVPKPAPSGLKPDQAYDVSLAMTNGSGGVDTTDPLQRLSVLPSNQQPLLVELGVAQDGNHVLFAVLHNALPSGPGRCIPGPIDCEILSLGQDQTERLSAQTGSVGPSQVALFAITGISATNYPSAAAAEQARRSASAVGRALLDASGYPTLSLFKYEPSRGSVVDLRNLGVS